MKRIRFFLMASSLLMSTAIWAQNAGSCFSDGPFLAIVSDVSQLQEALAAAKQSKAEHYYIFVKNGVYDFGTVAKTAIPKNTSLIGESEEGVPSAAVSKPVKKRKRK